MQQLSIGVIGAGSMGSRHAENLHQLVSGARVVAVYDLDPGRAAMVAAALDARPFMDAQSLIEDPGVDAVVIASPDDTHAAFARAVMEAGKPVLCEKPLATSAADARSVMQAERAAGRRLLSVGFMRRFDPQHVAVKQAVASGTVGRLLLLKGYSREQMMSNDRSVESILTNSMVHDFDAMRWYMQEDPVEVFARGLRSRSQFDAAGRDLILAQFVFPDGRMASIEGSFAVEYGYDIAVQAVCERGVCETREPAGAAIRSGQVQTVRIALDWLERFQTAYVAEFQAWVDSLRSGGIFPGAHGRDGYRALVLAEACLRSMRSGQPERIGSD
jgi:myo-inositol 2-dehydrogenase/D-chiro-inositol 1-dehydrogenase